MKKWLLKSSWSKNWEKSEDALLRITNSNRCKGPGVGEEFGFLLPPNI